MGACTSSQSVENSISPNVDQDCITPAQLQQLSEATINTVDEMVYRFNKAKVLKVYDGDSITIAAHHAGQIVKFNVRVFGIDCDEMKGGTEQTKRNARIAKKYVESKILGKVVDINVLNNKVVDGKKLREKYGRLLASISIDGADLANMLLEVKLARKYYGGHKDNTPLRPVVDLHLSDTDSVCPSHDESLAY